MSYNNLFEYYKTSRLLKSHFHYDLFEQAELIPFERDIILTLIMQEQKENKERNQSEDIFDPQGKMKDDY